MKPNYLVIILLVLLSFLSYYFERALFHASLLFNIFYIATILVSAWVLSKFELKTLVIFSLLAVALGFCVEFLNTEASNWSYYGGGQPPFYVALVWIYPLALIFYIASFSKKYLNWKTYSVIPTIICFGLFFLLSYIGGYIPLLTIGLYLIMAILGIYSSYSNSFGWNIGILLAGIMIGSLSEATGASCGLWSFRFGELLPLHMAFAWAVNAFAIIGLLKLLGLEPGKFFSE